VEAASIPGMEVANFSGPEECGRGAFTDGIVTVTPCLARPSATGRRCPVRKSRTGVKG
jgi:hypothetical protein